MVVIIIIGIVSALAVPTMAAARIDRNAYDDAGSIVQLLRSARTRAVARGGAVLVAMTFNGSSNRGKFSVYESVTTNPGGVGGAARSPVASCKAPSVWQPLDATNVNVVLVDGLDLNGSIEQDADIETELLASSPTAGVVANVPAAFLCFTPLGRTYYTSGAVPDFNGAMPALTPLEFRVTRMSAGVPVGTIRSVLLPPNGMARIFSHV